MEVVLEEDDSNNSELLWLMTAAICDEEVAIGGFKNGRGQDVDGDLKDILQRPERKRNLGGGMVFGGKCESWMYFAAACAHTWSGDVKTLASVPNRASNKHGKTKYRFPRDSRPKQLCDFLIK
ncbi:hypothetical protein LR48_Vigan10g137300 [Vigna angularis]|uniref:Uncharacterized protein n=1 Tax=Phaseolus angularis TaxID=3914 RepID=A0A0L9VKC2_PHAAN|nr:hypothetical protein LR48_Vigan10g137300 [Vigna angularis]